MTRIDLTQTRTLSLCSFFYDHNSRANPLLPAEIFLFTLGDFKQDTRQFTLNDTYTSVRLYSINYLHNAAYFL